MDRRKFLEKSLFAAGGLSLAGKKASSGETPAPAESKSSMKYRTLGRTGLRVSEVCFGTYGWQNTQVLEVAIEAGINLISTCADYQSGAAERAIAPVVAKHRDRIFILSGIDCMHDPGEQMMLERLDKSLENLGTDHLDLYVPHQADTVENVTNPAIPKAFEKMKSSGKARFLGISTHSPQLETMLNRAIDLGYYDIILCKYSFMEYKSQMKIFEKAARNDIGIIVFKIRAGAREAEVKELQEKGLDLSCARIRWALSNPNVTSVCFHFSNFAAVENSLEAVSRKFSLHDSRVLDQYRQAFDSSYCRNCGSCTESCPHGVDVASVMRYGMYFKYYGFEKEAIARYAALPENARPLACRDCHAPCEKSCPHGLPTRSNLLEASELLTLA